MTASGLFCGFVLYLAEARRYRSARALDQNCLRFAVRTVVLSFCCIACSFAVGLFALMIGTGGIIVLDDRACMADMARYLVGFFLDESCGKCVPCREGLRQLSRIMDQICDGSGSDADLLLLERLAGTMKAAAVCGLGGMAPSAVLATLQHFRAEFETHIRDKQCPAGVCRIPAGRSEATLRPAVSLPSGSVAGRVGA